MRIAENKKGVSSLVLAIVIAVVVIIIVVPVGLYLSGVNKTPSSEVQQVVGFSVNKSADGTTWTVPVTSVDREVYLNKIFPEIINKDGSKNTTAVVHLYSSDGRELASAPPPAWPNANLSGKLSVGYYFQFDVDVNMDMFKLSDDSGVLATVKLTSSSPPPPQRPELDHIVLTTHNVTYDPDTSTVTPSEVNVTAYDTSGKPMEGVKVTLEGCGIDDAKVTGKDGTCTFDLSTVSLPTNVHTGEIKVTAEYAGTTLKIVTDVIVVHTP